MESVDEQALVAGLVQGDARVFGTSAEFWLNAQRRNDHWTVMHTPEERARVERARPLNSAAQEARPRTDAPDGSGDSGLTCPEPANGTRQGRRRTSPSPGLWFSAL